MPWDYVGSPKTKGLIPASGGGGGGGGRGVENKGVKASQWGREVP